MIIGNKLFSCLWGEWDDVLLLGSLFCNNACSIMSSYFYSNRELAATTTPYETNNSNQGNTFWQHANNGTTCTSYHLVIFPFVYVVVIFLNMQSEFLIWKFIFLTCLLLEMTKVAGNPWQSNRLNVKSWNKNPKWSNASLDSHISSRETGSDCMQFRKKYAKYPDTRIIYCLSYWINSRRKGIRWTLENY